MWRTQGKLTHDFFILSRRHHHMLFVILFIFLLYFNLSSAKLHIFFQYANFFAIIFSFSSLYLAFTLLYSTAPVWVRSLLARAPHVLWLARPFNNLPNLLHKYSFHCINIQNGSVSWYAWNHSLKAWVSRCKTKGFTAWKQGFHIVIWWGWEHGGNIA